MAALQNRGVQHQHRGQGRRLIQPRRQSGFGVSQESQIPRGPRTGDVELRQGQRDIQTFAGQLQGGGRDVRRPRCYFGQYFSVVAWRVGCSRGHPDERDAKHRSQTPSSTTSRMAGAIEIPAHQVPFTLMGVVVSLVSVMLNAPPFTGTGEVVSDGWVA